MNTAINDVVELSFREDMGLLFGRWQRHASAPEVQLGYEAILAEAAPRRARYWLLDVRRRGSVSSEVARWVLETFLPSVAARLQGDVYIAYLLSPTHMTELLANDNTHAPTKNWQAQLFSSECAALQWLQNLRQKNGDLS
jgi:hypothetical protein